jgi:hypothetical protein
VSAALGAKRPAGVSPPAAGLTASCRRRRRADRAGRSRPRHATPRSAAPNDHCTSPRRRIGPRSPARGRARNARGRSRTAQLARHLGVTAQTSAPPRARSGGRNAPRRWSRPNRPPCKGR